MQQRTTVRTRVMMLATMQSAAAGVKTSSMCASSVVVETTKSLSGPEREKRLAIAAADTDDEVGAAKEAIAAFRLSWSDSVIRATAPEHDASIATRSPTASILPHTRNAASARPDRLLHQLMSIVERRRKPIPAAITVSATTMEAIRGCAGSIATLEKSPAPAMVAF